MIVAERAVFVIAVGYQGSGEVFGDVHELMDEGSFLVVGREAVEVFRKNLNTVVSRNAQSHLPNFGQAPNAGPSPRGGGSASEANQVCSGDMPKRQTFHQKLNSFGDIGSRKQIH